MWYYYYPNKPWEGGYWTPLLPDYPPYHEYKWNPDTCRFEHKQTGQPLHPWVNSIASSRSKAPKPECDWDLLGLREDKPIELQAQPRKKSLGWLRFILEENICTLMEKRKRKKWAEQKRKND
ncbi:MAG: hypothetical protein HDS56_08405 [Barnesiella sp.]|nr:hypothetical protein [Barnesiella sp.]